jgi:hypothetical protein
MRVGFLEKALKPARKLSSTDDLNRSRKDAEFDARYKALMEYYKQKKVEYYLRNPEDLAKDLARERELAEFLRARGLKPDPSSIPEQFHRGLKKYRSKADAKD